MHTDIIGILRDGQGCLNNASEWEGRAGFSPLFAGTLFNATCIRFILWQAVPAELAAFSLDGNIGNIIADYVKPCQSSSRLFKLQEKFVCKKDAEERNGWN